MEGVHVKVLRFVEQHSLKHLPVCWPSESSQDIRLIESNESTGAQVTCCSTLFVHGPAVRQGEHDHTLVSELPAFCCAENALLTSMVSAWWQSVACVLCQPNLA